MLNRVIDDLEEQIRTSELRVIDYDTRLRSDVHRLRHDAAHAVGAKLAAVAGLLVAGWLLRRSRRVAHRDGVARVARGRRFGGLLAWALRRALPLLLPLLSPLLNRRAARTLAGLGLPIGAPRALAPLRTEPTLDLARYAGLWYEIARLPRRFERRCAGDVLTHYSVDGDGLIVVNRCRDERGETREAAGRLRAPDPRVPAELEVSYAPLWLRWWPGAWHDHWVIYVDAEYSCALVGTPERDGLWVLAREPELPDPALQALLTLASRLGFDTSRVRLTPQSAA
jgi:apolipoprotein D and lipocalin family protein